MWFKYVVNIVLLCLRCTLNLVGPNAKSELYVSLSLSKTNMTCFDRLSVLRQAQHDSVFLIYFRTVCQSELVEDQQDALRQAQRDSIYFNCLGNKSRKFKCQIRTMCQSELVEDQHDALRQAQRDSISFNCLGNKSRKF